MSARKKRVTKPGGSRARKVVDLAPRRQKVRDLVKFIDAHGGKLGVWQAYRPRRP